MLKVKAIQLNLEIVVKVLVLLLVLFGAAYLVMGKDWKLNAEASKTTNRLVEAFVTVAKNYEKYDYFNRFGGGNKVCKVPLNSTEPCGVEIDLPQELHILTLNALPAFGDPKYIVYWDSYDNVESGFWSGWVYLDVFLLLLPEEKIAEFGGKIAEISGKIIETAGKAALEGSLGEGLRLLGRSVKFVLEKTKDAFSKGIEIVLKDENGESRFTKSFEKLKEGLRKLVKSGEKDAEPLEKNAELMESVTKNTETMLSKAGFLKNLRATIITKTDSLKGLSLMEKLSGIKGGTIEFFKTLVDNGKIRFCAPAGVIAALTLDEMKKEGIIKEKNGNYYYKGQPIEQELLWTVFFTAKKDTIYTYVYNAKKKLLQKLKIFEEKPEPEESLLFILTWNKEKDEWESDFLGTVKEVMENPKLRVKTLGNCFVAGSITFLTTYFIHKMEAKYEIYEKEKEICKNAICLKGTEMYPRAVKKDELKYAMENGKICGIKMMNANKYGGKAIPGNLWSIMPPQFKDFLKTHGVKVGYDPSVHEFYLASPCYAFAQIWVASCDDPKKKCEDSELCTKWKETPCADDAHCCRRCIWVSLQKGIGLPFEDLSDFNYCFPAPEARFISFLLQQPWPYTGYWANICNGVQKFSPILSWYCPFKKMWDNSV